MVVIERILKRITEVQQKENNFLKKNFDGRRIILLNRRKIVIGIY